MLLKIIGEDNVLFETDFPHPTSLYPGVQERIMEVLGDYTSVVRKKMLQTNAAKLYNLPSKGRSIYGQIRKAAHD
jgi:predicted TIM-barrel fold metal-dependent hydrolase